MLLGNYSTIQRSLGRYLGGAAVSDVPSAFAKTGAVRCCCWGDQAGGYSLLTSIPAAYRPPYTWILAQQTGAIGSNTLAVATTTSTANLAGGKYGEGAASASFDATGAADLVAWLVATGAGVFDVANVLSAAINGSAAATAAWTSDAAVSGAIGGAGHAEADFVAAGAVSGALGGGGAASFAIDVVALASAAINAVAACASSSDASGWIAGVRWGEAGFVAAFAATGALGAPGHAGGDAAADFASDADLRAKAWLSADVTPYTELSPQSLAAAVWSAVASQYDASGTMGRLLNASGGGSDPETIATAVWAALAAGNASPSTLGLVLVELHRLMGLDATHPLVTTDTMRTAGDIQQAIVEDATSVTVTRT